MEQVYNENSIITLDYRESARQSLGMYIGSSDTQGMHHLLIEIVANSIDEAAAGYGKKIKVVIDKDENRATVIDNGRGIPFKKNSSGNWAVIEMCTNLHSGGKFSGQGNYKSSLGLNGVGATVTNALSTEFSIQSWRDGEHCTFQVFDGEHDDEPTIEKTTRKETGSEVSFIPDPQVFGDCKWDIKKIEEELQLHALLNTGISFELIVKDSGEIIEDKVFVYKNGIKDMLQLKTAGQKMLTNPVYFKTTVEDDKSGEQCDVEFAFAYSDKTYETIYSFVNGGYTPNNGTHVTGWKTAYTSLINKLAKEQDVIKDKNFSGDIVRKGLVLVLSIRMQSRPMFGEQTKLTLNSPIARTFCSKAVGQLVLDSKASKEILNKIMIEQKAEDAAQRKREAQEKITKGGKNLNALRDLPEKLADASDFTDAEIFFCEGDSAGGGAKVVKSQNQAILPLRGKIKNVQGMELADAIKSDVIRNILNCLGCGVGEHFNINNLRYNRLIIMTDADPIKTIGVK